MGFISGEKRETSVRSKNISLLAHICLLDFEQILKSFPHDYEKYCELRDEIKINKSHG